MKWDKLERSIPYLVVFAGPPIRVPILTSSSGYEVSVVQPGRHFKTEPLPGGDFRVEVRGDSGRAIPIRFRALMDDTEAKRAWGKSGKAEREFIETLVDRALFKAVTGEDPVSLARTLRAEARKRRCGEPPGYPLEVWLTIVQCLALSEHRRYGTAQEPKGGGRFLLARVLHGILLGKWTSKAAYQVTESSRWGTSESKGGLSALSDLELKAGWNSAFKLKA